MTTSESRFRINSAKKQLHISYARFSEWIPVQFFNQLKSAAKSKDAPPAELLECISLFEKEIWTAGSKLKKPLPAAALDEIQTQVDHQRTHYQGLKRFSHPSYSAQQKTEKIENALKQFKEGLIEAQSSYLAMKWLKTPITPHLNWVSDPAKATLLTFEKAKIIVDQAIRFKRISELLPIVEKQSAALGFPIEKWYSPRHRKLTSTIETLAKATLEEFNPASEFVDCACFAVYATTSRDKGFAANGALKQSIGSARLFPTYDLAHAYALKNYRNSFAVVTLDISPTAFVSHGQSGDFDDLSAAVANREAQELTEILAKADLSRLKAEVAQREDKPAPVKAKSNRL